MSHTLPDSEGVKSSRGSFVGRQTCNHSPRKLRSNRACDGLRPNPASQLNKDTRLLRVGKSTDDINNEARSWVHIGGFNRTKEEAKSWLQKWIYDGENMESVGKKLGLYNLPENEMLNHINFEALRKFVRIDYYQRTGYKLPKGYALKKITG
ncbi:hypothetical protein GQ600_27288 [Phytophthora cactorum]|nr:hypothetical protein GQ600_27288 [Phytophthora cactorum]